MSRQVPTHVGIWSGAQTSLVRSLFARLPSCKVISSAGKRPPKQKPAVGGTRSQSVEMEMYSSDSYSSGSPGGGHPPAPRGGHRRGPGGLSG